MGGNNYKDKISKIRQFQTPIVRKYYPSKATREVLSLYDLITFGILSHLLFSRNIKRAYTHFIDELGLFPRIRYNKLIERLPRIRGTFIQGTKLCFFQFIR